MNTKFTPDSPELTAYALGELPPATRAALEAQLAVDPMLQTELAALQSTAGRLSTELALEKLPELAPVQRSWIHGQLDQTAAGKIEARPTRPQRRFVWWWVLGSGATAVLAAVIAVRSLGLPERSWGRPSGLPSVSPETASASPVPTITPASPAPPNELSDQGVRTITANADSRGRSPKPTAVESPVTVQTALPTETQTRAQKPQQAIARGAAGIAARELHAPATTEAAVPASEQFAPASSSKLAPQSIVRDPLRADTKDLFEQPAASASVAASGQAATSASQNSSLGRSAALEPRARAPLTTPVRPKVAFKGGKVVEESLALAPPDSSHRYRPLDRPETSDPNLARRYAILPVPEGSTERYAAISENPFRPVDQAPLSTFSLDVDTASYANVRRFLREGSRPPPDAVSIEELINYFPYDLPGPKASDPFGVVVEVAACPWNAGHRLIRVGLRAREIPGGERPPANLVFLVDVSGSMEPENKLPLVKKSLRLLVDQLTPRDRVALVTYAGEAGVALEPTAGSEKDRITQAIDRLTAGGSTHGSAGIVSAYELARKSFVKAGINRVLLCTDGDFNVGTTSQEGLLSLITEQARSGVFLSVLGYGMGNYQDATTELLADKGNGNYAYIDSFREARKVLREQLHATLVTVAKDVKVQIEFNPAKVASWRLLGYENRALADRDFKDDQKDAGEVGAGQSVTVLYEVEPAGTTVAGLEDLRYQRKPVVKTDDRPPAATTAATAEFRDELLFLKLRYKQPDAGAGIEWSVAVKDDDRSWTRASDDFQFSAAVAGFGMLLRHSSHGGSVSYPLVQRLAQEGLGADQEGYRAEFIDLVRQAERLSGQDDGVPSAPQRKERRVIGF